MLIYYLIIILTFKYLILININKPSLRVCVSNNFFKLQLSFQRKKKMRRTLFFFFFLKKKINYFFINLNSMHIILKLKKTTKTSIILPLSRTHYCLIQINNIFHKYILQRIINNQKLHFKNIII